MSRVVSPSASPIPEWHRRFLRMLPIIAAHARISFWYLGPEARGEAVQAVVCNAMQAFVRLVELGKEDVTYPTVLARYGVAQVKDGRMVGGHLNIRDISSEYCQRQKGVIVERLDHYDEEEECWREALVEDRRAGPAEIAASRLDFAAWLASLSRRNRRIAQFLALGNRTSDAARKFDVSEGRVSQLRRELAASWREFLGGNPPGACTGRAAA